MGIAYQIPLCQAGFGQVWLFECGNESMFLNMLKERLRDLFCQNWFSHFENSDRFALCNCHRSCLDGEEFVDLILTDAYGCALAIFRMGVSPINALNFRYTNTEQRSCPFCSDKKNDIFNVATFLFFSFKLRHSLLE